MRQAEYGVYGFYLTFTDEHSINAGAYKATDDPAIVFEYKKQVDKILRRLIQTLRNHKKTKKGGNWEGTIKAIASCHKIRDGVAEPDRLHIHLMFTGMYGATIEKFIIKYWHKHFDAKAECRKKDPDWLNRYLDEQAFKTKNATI